MRHVLFLWLLFKFHLLPIGIVWVSAGTIRAVPDTVKKVPGLAPVLFLNHCDWIRIAENIDAFPYPLKLKKQK